MTKLSINVQFLLESNSRDTRILIFSLRENKYEVISGPHFPVFNPNTGKYGPEITPYLDTFHAVSFLENLDIGKNY